MEGGRSGERPLTWKIFISAASRDFSAASALVIPELSLPTPLTYVLAPILPQLIHDVDGVNEIHHQALHLQLHDAHAFEVE